MNKLNVLNMTIRYREGLFNDKNMNTLAKAISLLLEKVDEQTETINKLIDKVDKLENKKDEK